MQGRTAHKTATRVSKYINCGWKIQDNEAGSDLSIEASSILISHPSNSLIHFLDTNLLFISKTLSNEPVRLTLLPTDTFLSSAKSLLAFCTHSTAFGGESCQKNITDAQKGLLAASVSAIGLHLDHISNGLGNERLISDRRQAHRPPIFGLSFRQSFTQLFQQVCCTCSTPPPPFFSP